MKVHVDEEGRLTLPRVFRDFLGVPEGGELEVALTRSGARLRYPEHLRDINEEPAAQDGGEALGSGIRRIDGRLRVTAQFDPTASGVVDIVDLIEEMREERTAHLFGYDMETGEPRDSQPTKP